MLAVRVVFGGAVTKYCRPLVKILRLVLKQIRGHGHGTQFPVVVPDCHLIRRAGGAQGCQEQIIMFGGGYGFSSVGQFFREFFFAKTVN